MRTVRKEHIDQEMEARLGEDVLMGEGKRRNDMIGRKDELNAWVGVGKEKVI